MHIYIYRCIYIYKGINICVYINMYIYIYMLYQSVVGIYIFNDIKVYTDMFQQLQHLDDTIDSHKVCNTFHEEFPWDENGHIRFI